MNDSRLQHADLLAKVSQRLATVPDDNDFAMLTKWRVLSFCQHLFGKAPPHIERACREALRIFADEGINEACNSALQVAIASLKEVSVTHGSLPSIASHLQEAVDAHLATLGGTEDAIAQAHVALPTALAAIRKATHLASLPGISYRFECVAEALDAPHLSAPQRARLAAAVLYVDEANDVIPDNLGAIGMLDDDYALRRVLLEVGPEEATACLHWSERIASLWDNLPFIGGINLKRDNQAVSTSWLERVTTYVAYGHIASRCEVPLLLEQPSVLCSPLHTIVSLIGLLVLDATSATAGPQEKDLKTGQIYDLDGYFVKYENIHTGPPTPGWIRLRFKDGARLVPPGVADRLIPVGKRALSRMSQYDAHSGQRITEPVQKFLGWNAAIGPRALRRSIVFVSTNKRALALFKGVESNGTKIMEHGLVRFFDPDAPAEIRGTAVHVVRSLSQVRTLLDQGVTAEAVFVDGANLLMNGQNDLRFLRMRENPPPVIVWYALGGVPEHLPDWLFDCRRLSSTTEDLIEMSDLDSQRADPVHVSLLTGTTASVGDFHATPYPKHEKDIQDGLDELVKTIRQASHFDEGWRLQALRHGQILRLLVLGTPATWREIQKYAENFMNFLRQPLKPSGSANALGMPVIRDLYTRLQGLFACISERLNSKAMALQTSDKLDCEVRWIFACLKAEQAQAAEIAFEEMNISNVQAETLRDLEVCSNVIVAGWTRLSFSQSLWARTPRSVLYLVDDEAQVRWRKSFASRHCSPGGRLLEAIGGHRLRGVPPAEALEDHMETADEEDLPFSSGPSGVTPCVLLWIAGEADVLLLACDESLFVESREGIVERRADTLNADDKIILNRGMRSDAPADDFTKEVLQAMRSAYPERVREAREWRVALARYAKRKGFTANELSHHLAKHGLDRGVQTLEAWIDLNCDFPIAPLRGADDFELLWPLIAEDARVPRDIVLNACKQLRRQCTEAAKALLQLYNHGTSPLLGSEGHHADLAKRLRRRMRVHEIEAVTHGKVPDLMLGLWVSRGLASRYASASIK